MPKYYEVEVLENGTKRNIFQFPKGIKAVIKPVAPMFFLELEKAFPRPRPPIKRIKNDDGTYSEAFEDSADKNYIERLLPEWSRAMEVRGMELNIKLGLELEIDETAVKEKREFWREMFGKELPQSDKYVYVALCLCEDVDTLNRLNLAFGEIGTITKDGVAAATATF